MIEFTKMQGLGNDYVYMDCTKKQIPDNVEDLARFVSNRHFGIGSDGLILILKSDVADFKMKMFNSDGTEAQMCGNGIRCVGKFVYDKALTNKTTITVETLAGIKNLVLNIKEGKVDTVCVDMGKPILEPAAIPITSEKNKLSLNILDKEFEFTCVSMGNPHAVTYVKDVKNIEIEKYGPIIENDKHFPERINVEFIEVIDKENIKMRVWERGSGETLACGTGACASVVSSILNGYTNDEVNVELLGGILNIKWDRQGSGNIYMTGPAKTVFEGKLI